MLKSSSRPPTRSRRCFRRSIGLLCGLAIAIPLSASVPEPSRHHPGNVFTRGERVKLPPVHGKPGAWEVVDIDGEHVASGASTAAGFDLGELPVGHYRIRVGEEMVATAAVLEPLRAAAPRGGPINVKTWFAGHYILNRIDSIDDAMSLAALAGVSGVCDATAWTWQQNDAGSWTDSGPRNAESFGQVIAAARRTGLDLLIGVEPGTPKFAEHSPDWGLRTRTKFPADLRDYARFVRRAVKRAGDGVHAWEAWNEPDGIGGGHLSSETASATKVFALAARSVRPDAQIGMAKGHVPAEALERNGYHLAVDSYNYHGHRTAELIAKKRRAFDRFTGGLPVWNTEASYGAYALEPGGTELTPEAERQQARDIPMLFARCLHEGNERVYYFTLMQVGETAGMQWGLLRTRSLQPRPGYLALAATGRLLAGAKPAGALSGLPRGLEGWAFESEPDGAKKIVAVLWATGDRPIEWRPPAGASMFDLWGRSINANAAIPVGADPVWCVLPPDRASGLARAPLPARDVSGGGKSDALCPVVADYRRPDRLKNQAGNFFLLTQPKPRLDIDIYNFASSSQNGIWTADPIEGYTMTVEQPGVIEPDGRRVLKVILNPVGKPKGGTGGKTDWLRLTGDYGRAGRSVISIPFVHFSSETRPSVSMPLAGFSDPKRWVPTAASGSEIRVDSAKEWTVFDATFGAALNSTIGITWAAPAYSLPSTERPPASTWGVTLRLRNIEAPPGTAFALNLVKRNGAAWTCPLPFEREHISAAEGGRLLLPLSWFAHMAHRAPDPDGKLTVDDIVGLEVAIIGAPSMTGKIEISELAWAGGDAR